MSKEVLAPVALDDRYAAQSGMIERNTKIHIQESSQEQPQVINVGGTKSRSVNRRDLDADSPDERPLHTCMTKPPTQKTENITETRIRALLSFSERGHRDFPSGSDAMAKPTICIQGSGVSGMSSWRAFRGQKDATKLVPTYGL